MEVNLPLKWKQHHWVGEVQYIPPNRETATQLEWMLYESQPRDWIHFCVHSCHKDSRAFKPWYLLSDLYRKGAEPCDYSIGCTLESLLKKAQGAGLRSTPRPQTSRMGSRNHCVPSRCLESRLPWKHISGSKCVFTWDMALDEAL